MLTNLACGVYTGFNICREGFKLSDKPKAFKCQIPNDHNELIKAEAERLGMSRQKYIEKRIIEAAVIKLALKIQGE